jgi:glutamyl-Q tRNA(Asp) synthetase
VFGEIAADGSVRPVPAQPGRWGDAVIVRKEFPASYHLAVVTDDHRQGMTHVTRGMDLFAATDLHRLLQVLLDLDEPLYHHHPLMLGADGRKLSKSEGATAIKMLHRQGINPDEVRRRAMQDCPLPRLAVC